MPTPYFPVAAGQLIARRVAMVADPTLQISIDGGPPIIRVADRSYGLVFRYSGSNKSTGQHVEWRLGRIDRRQIRRPEAKGNGPVGEAIRDAIAALYVHRSEFV